MEHKMISCRQLRIFSAGIFEKIGFSEEDASVISRILEDSDQNGNLKYGTSLLPALADACEKDIFSPDSLPEILEDTAVTAFIEAHGTVPFLTGYKAMNYAIKKARNTGIGLVTVMFPPENMEIFSVGGAAGFYKKMADKGGLLGSLYRVSEVKAFFDGILFRKSADIPAGENDDFCFLAADSFIFRDPFSRPETTEEKTRTLSKADDSGMVAADMDLLIEYRSLCTKYGLDYKKIFPEINMPDEEEVQE